LYDLPIVTHFKKDAGPFITSSIVFSENQEKGKQNQSTHRLLRLDDRHMAIRMVEGRHLHKYFTYARDHGEDLKVAIAIGVHQAVNIAAAYQAAYGVDEMLIANSLFGVVLYYRGHAIQNYMFQIMPKSFLKKDPERHDARRMDSRNAPHLRFQTQTASV
jgi:UbiD family decarboxylase